jgi:two-component system, NtrC family, sensor histidine kinase HydH
MTLRLINRYSVPLIALGTLVAIVCLAGSWYINRLQTSLAQTVHLDAAGMAAAVDLQLQLRHLRVHSLTLVADDTAERRAIVKHDLANVDRALQAVRDTARAPDDEALASRIEHDYALYKQNLGLDNLPPAPIRVNNLAQWSDAHHMAELLEPCRALADHLRERMNNSLQQSETQTAWAGRALLVLGVVGILAGLLSGYATARAITRRVARLSIQVQAVHAQLDQEVGALTVQRPAQFGELDEQLDRIVQRVSAVCHKLQEQERDLLRAEQLAAVGQLAAAVAHEVRNPLTGVKLLLQAAVRTANPTPLSIDRLQLVLNEVGRIERTVQGLMNFAQPAQSDRRPAAISAAVSTAIQAAQSKADSKNVAIRFEPVPRSASVAVDSDQFQSLLTNLLFNAIDASPAGSSVDVNIEPSPEGMIKVTVSDAGPGIEPALAEKIFAPFVTSKPTGTGLGLTIARKIADDHGGELTVRSRSHGGTTFTLELPCLESLHVQASGRR